MITIKFLILWSMQNAKDCFMTHNLCYVDTTTRWFIWLNIFLIVYKLMLQGLIQILDNKLWISYLPRFQILKDVINLLAECVINWSYKFCRTLQFFISFIINWNRYGTFGIDFITYSEIMQDCDLIITIQIHVFQIISKVIDINCFSFVNSNSWSTFLF